MIAIVGAIDASARGRPDRRGLRRSAGQATKPVADAAFAGVGHDRHVDLDVPQSTIRFGRPAWQRDDPDYIASIVPPMCSAARAS